MMKFQIEGDLGVEGSDRTLTFRHPNGSYEVHLRNQDMTPGAREPLVSAFVVFNADNIKDAASAGQLHVDRFLEFLAFATGSRFGSVRRVCLYDWSVDQKEMREGQVYKYVSDPNIPQLVLNDQVVSTVEALLQSDGTNADVMQALAWFSDAVAARGAQQQFQLFWFCIETLARLSRDVKPVADVCQTCREGLYCRKCEKIPTHRPFPVQAVKQLFGRFVSGDADELYRLVSKMRNALMHGNAVAEVEQESGKSLEDLVDHVGHLAWVALLHNLLAVSPHKGTVRLTPIQPNTFLHRQHVFTAQIAVGFALGREPNFDELPNFQIDWTIVERPDEGRTASPSPYVTRR